jgi:hypothetical protein
MGRRGRGDSEEWGCLVGLGVWLTGWLTAQVQGLEGWMMDDEWPDEFVDGVLVICYFFSLRFLAT